MRVFIQSLNGAPWNEECGMVLQEFSQLGVECIMFSSTEELTDATREDVVVGGTLITRHVFDIFGIKTDNDSYPPELTKYLGRKIWKTNVSNITEADLPLFVKPKSDKLAKGTIVLSLSKLYEYQALPGNTEVICSEIVEFVSEWRCFVIDNSIVGIKHYIGDENCSCNHKVIESALAAFHNCPSGFAMDFGITSDGRTLLVEVNDGYALGAYGLEPKLYCKLLTTRWRELMGTKE